MIDHFSILVRDLAKSRSFYLSILEPLGYEIIIDMKSAVSFGVLNGPTKSSDPGGEFWLTSGSPTQAGLHFAFACRDKTSVDQFHAQGLKSGGVGNGLPGIRSGYHPSYYAAYLLDPDGYNIEAVCHLP